MQDLYEFEYKDMEFSKDGSLDELLALDRYAIQSYDNYNIGDTIVAIVDKNKGSKKVGTIEDIEDDLLTIKDRHGDVHKIKKDLTHKPLETTPQELWSRWAKGAASVENEDIRQHWENEFRWLFDGYRYSLGGRIQLMLGQEFVTGKKSILTGYNCFVSASPKSSNVPKTQFLNVLQTAYTQARIHRAGGGDGINLSTIQTVKGSGKDNESFIFYLSKTHPDIKELYDRLDLDKIKNVTIVTDLKEFNELIKMRNAKLINAIDSVEDGLFDNAMDMVSHSYDGFSVAVDFTGLRPRNAIVKSVNGRSSGAESWMELFVLIANILQLDEIDCVEFAEIFSFVVNLIQQGGSRRGALMLILNVDNSSIMKFITRKQRMGYLQGANISVGINDEFMNRVKLGEKRELEIWNTLIESAWKSAEPGIVWLERYNKESNSWYFSEIICTNPCGEQGLPAWGVCNLGHHVLSRYYSKKPIYTLVQTESSELYYPEWNELIGYNTNWDDLARACRISVRLQDNIVDYTPYFLKENKELQTKEHRVGIGTMALGTLMIKLGLRYGSEEGNKFIDTLYKFITYNLYKESINLAEEKGSFSAFDYEKHIQSGFMKRLLNEFPDLNYELKKKGIRNVTLCTEAPTGSTATYIDNIPQFVEKFSGASTGIEPYFAFKFYRASRLGEGFEQTMAVAQQYMNEHDIKNLDDLPDFFVTAMDLQPIDHVTVQAAIQKWTDSSISKTANCPNDYTVDQIADLYMQAYDMGLKGCTIYRDGSREAQVLSTDKDKAKLEQHLEAERLERIKQEESEHQPENTSINNNDQINIVKRPSRLFGFTEKVKFMSGEKLAKAYVTINIDEDGEPIEVFVSTNDAALNEFADSIGRLTTQFLRFAKTQSNVDQLVKHLRANKPMSSLSAKIASLIEQTAYGKIKVPTPKKPKNKKPIFQICPDCGERAYDKANCICTKCGSSHCN